MNWLKKKLKQLITHYSSPQHLLTSDELVALKRKSWRKQVLIGRDLCQYQCINLNAVPRARRVQALQHQLAINFFGERLAYSVAWRQGIAQVWYWDISSLPFHAETSDSSLQSPFWVAEAVYWEPPPQDGVYLYKAHKGYDLHSWQYGILHASQWFAECPTLDQLKRFVRGQSLSLKFINLEATQPQLRTEPWAGVQISLVDNLLEHRARGLTLLASISFFVFTLQVTSLMKVYWGIHNLDKQLAGLEGVTAELLVARGQARENAIKLQNLFQLLNIPDALSAQQLVQSRLPVADGRKLVAWERNINQINITLQGKIADTLSLVKALEQQGISNVKVEPQAEIDNYKISMTLSPKDKEK